MNLKYVLGCWIIIFVNTNNIYEITFNKEKIDPMLLKLHREDSLTDKTSSIKKNENNIICNAIISGIKILKRYKIGINLNSRLSINLSM